MEFNLHILPAADLVNTEAQAAQSLVAYCLSPVTRKVQKKADLNRATHNMRIFSGSTRFSRKRLTGKR